MTDLYFIGVDTGGTYTDAAVIAAVGHRVVASAKALTTKGDLAVGVRNAIARAVAALPQQIDPAQISLVSVSTTLATNAVVEGHGSATGVLLIGFDAAMVERTGIAKAFTDMPMARIGGGHDHNGEAREPLDEAALSTAIASMNREVDAFAVAGSFAIRNPAHEQRAGEMISAATGKPVTLSTELSSNLDAPRRALTAVLNARLIARISMLIGAVERAMADLRIACPLMIVRGDGTLALARSVAMRPIETILSGPAASLVGAAWLSGLSDFIMSDMGGTTTDVGILSKGRPAVSPHGADVGGWRTMVKAIDVRTIGLGGDSEISFGLNGVLKVGPARIVPIALIGSEFPELPSMLDADLAESEGGSLLGRFVMRPLGTTGGAEGELTSREREILALVGERPRPLRKVAVSSGAQRTLAGLRRKGIVQLCGFTPSDAAHVLGLQNNWSRLAAEKAAAIAIRFREMRAATPERIESFSREVWSEVVRLTGGIIIDVAMGEAADAPKIVDAVTSGKGAIGLARLAITPCVPVVAVGGPVRIYYGELGRRLGSEIVFPPHCDVANAVGAATGVVATSITVAIEGDGNGLFRMYGSEGVQSFGTGTAALAAGEAAARDAAASAIRNLGAGSFEIRVEIDKSHFPDAVDDNGLLKAEIRAEAIGRPELAISRELSDN